MNHNYDTSNLFSESLAYCRGYLCVGCLRQIKFDQIFLPKVHQRRLKLGRNHPIQAGNAKQLKSVNLFKQMITLELPWWTKISSMLLGWSYL